MVAKVCPPVNESLYFGTASSLYFNYERMCSGRTFADQGSGVKPSVGSERTGIGAIGRPVVSSARRRAERTAGHWADVFVDSHFAAAAAQEPDRLAVVDGAVSLTYAQADTRVGALAAALQSLGAAPGDVVSWQLPNWYEGYLLHHAVVRIGAVSNPIVPIYRQREVEFILREAGSRIVVVPDVFRGFSYRSMIEELRPALPRLESVIVARPQDDEHGLLALHDLWADDDAKMTPVRRTADDPILLMFTSGTTARPKAALHSHNTLDYENRSLIDVFELSERDVVFMPSPITHMTGLAYGLQLAPMLRAPLVLQDVWEPRRALELISTYRCSFTLAATPFLHGVVYHPDVEQFDLSSLRVVVCGGADVPPKLMLDAGSRFGCIARRAYGSTEMPTLTTTGSGLPAEKGVSTDGRAIGAAQFRIVTDDGLLAAPGEVGEIVATGPELFLGYLRPADNERAFDPDGWFHTGDLASVDPDGYLTVRGRAKDIVLRGGENISVSEVESLLFEHPGVREVAIVAMPDPVMSERACAYVVPTEDYRPTLDELCAFLEQHNLARQKLPERLELVGELPKTPSGKVQKFRLRDMIRAKLEQSSTREVGVVDDA